jgi:holo-[acyl-carrier protein] synthase
VVIGIGIDIVEVRRISRALQGGDEMANRVFTENELKYCRARKNQFQHFAGRFAAKEAALKALGTGWQEGIRWKDVEVVSDELGKPLLNFQRRAKEFLDASGAKLAHVTITHAKEYAVAAVILETGAGS